jgi:putative aminopeptidase FrvX
MIMRYYAAVLLQVLDHEIIMHHRRVLLLLLLLLLRLLCMKKLDLQVALRLVTKEEVGKEGSNAVEESLQEENLLIQSLLDQA